MKNLLESKNIRGTNQYRVKRKLLSSTYWNLLFLPLLFFLCLDMQGMNKTIHPANAQVISPLPNPQKEEQVIKTAIDSQIFNSGYTDKNPSKTTIENEIRTVFGNYAPVAFQLLQCENSSLNPTITYTNTDGSIDTGVFQINNKWQAVQTKFLTNYRINILIAKQLFDENGHQFNLWTCGQKLGI